MRSGGKVDASIPPEETEANACSMGAFLKVQLAMEDLMMKCLGVILLAQHQSGLSVSHASLTKPGKLRTVLNKTGTRFRSPLLPEDAVDCK